MEIFRLRIHLEDGLKDYFCFLFLFFIFNNKVINKCNKLQPSIVLAGTLNSIKDLLDKHCQGTESIQHKVTDENKPGQQTLDSKKE